MRSPWSVGAIALAWMAIAGGLAGGPLQALVLWTIGVVGFSMFVIRPAGSAKANLPARRLGPGHLADASGVDSTQPPSGSEVFRSVSATEPVGLASGGTGDDGHPAQLRPNAPLVPGHPFPTELKILSADHVARLLGVERIEVVRAMECGELPGNRIGTKWLCSEKSLRVWLDGSWT